MAAFTPALTGLSRVYLIDGRANPNHTPSYESCLKAGAPSQTFGDVEKVECPDPNSFGKWVEMGSIKAATERARLPLQGRYAIDVKSELLRLALKGCAADVQVHFGECTDPSVANTFTKALVVEDAYLTNWESEDLGALASGDNAAVNESTEVSASAIYEVLPMVFAEKAGALVVNEVMAGTLCDTVSCGTCSGLESSGSDKAYFLTKGAGGSAGTPAYVVYTKDKGITWYGTDVDSWATAVDGAGIACIGNYIAVIATSATDPMAYALKSEFDGVHDPTFTDSITGFVAAGTPRAIWSWGPGAFIVGSVGYIYKCTDATAGVTVLDAGVLTSANLTAVHGISEQFAVAVGAAGAILKTEDGTTWSVVTPLNINFIATNFTGIAVRSKYTWMATTSSGRLYYTTDGGTSWFEKTFPGSGSGTAYAIAFSTDTIGYLAHGTTTPRGRLLRTFDGGNSWVLLPESTQTMVTCDYLRCIAVGSDPNLVLAGGLADNGSDGIIVMGSN